MRITSTANPVVRQIQALASVGSRHDQGLFIAEGVRLVSEAYRCATQPSVVLYDPDEMARTALGSALALNLAAWGQRVYEVDARVLKAAAQTQNPGGVVVVLPLPEPTPLDVQFRGVGVILDGVSDPGNVGTILRAADAFGVPFVIAMPGCADVFSPKVVRAGMGAHFRLSLHTRSQWTDIGACFSELPFVAAAARQGDSVDAFDWPTRSLLVIGGEANGLSPDAVALVNTYLHIPMRTGVESLNAAMAASIMLFTAYMSAGHKAS